MEEDLIEAYDNFVVGNFSKCLQLAETAVAGFDFAQYLWDSLQVRSYLGLGNMERVKELARSASNPAMASSGYFAVYSKSAAETQKKLAFDKLIETSVATGGADPVTNYYCAVARGSKDLVDAFNFAKSVAATSPSEFLALQTQFALAMHRPDIAEHLLVTNKAFDDSAAFKLANAMLNLLTRKAVDAYMCYSDLIAQYDGGAVSTILTNGRAIANIQRGLYAEAQEDLDSMVDPNGDTLANLACCLAHEGKSGEAKDVFDKLVATQPNHGLVQRMNALNEVFA